MNQRVRTMFGAMAAMWCCLSLSHESYGQSLPEGKGKAEFVHNCTACHRADMVTAAKKTPEEWKKSVFEMAARGADGSQEDLNNVVLYLVKNYATGQDSTPTAPTTPLTAAERDNVTGVIAENGCLICHRMETQGGYLGPSLNGIGQRRTPDQIRSAIVHPHPTLDPANALAKLVTPEGKMIVARMLSQDDHSVRIVDGSGGAVTYARSSLRQFTLIETNPMQSYEKRIAPEDLSSLVRYLGSLPSSDDGIKR